MKKLLSCFALFCLALLLPPTTTSAPLYWDLTGGVAGAGGASPAGTWTAAGTNWNASADGSGPLVSWTSGSDAVFSAGVDATGAFTVTITGTHTASSLTVEEGIVSLAVGAAAVGAGNVTVNAGATLSTDSSLRLTSTAGATMNVNGGTLRSTHTANAGSFVDFDFIMTVGAGGATFEQASVNINTILQDGSAPATIRVTGPGGITKTGVGVLAIACATTYLGPTIINAGEVRIRTTANRLPITTPVTVNSPGILNLNAVNQQIGSLAGNGDVGLGNGILTVGDANNTLFAGAIKDVANAGASGVTSGAGRVSKIGAGILTLSGLNTFTGSITQNAGGIIVAPGALLAGAAADLVVNGGTLTLNNAAQTVLSLSGASSAGTVHLNTGHTLTVNPGTGARIYAGAITGPGQLIKSGAGTTGLSGNSSYDGTTFVNAGKLLIIQSSTVLGSTVGGTEVAAGAELLIEGSTNVITINEPLTIAGTGAGDGGAITVQATANATISGPVTLTGAAPVTNTVSGTGTALYNNANAITSLANQSLALQGGSGAGGGGTISGVISLGSGSLSKHQGGRWILSAANTYSGGTFVNAGTLQVNNVTGSGTGSGAVNVASGATLNGNGIISGPVTVASGGTLAPGTSIGTLTLQSSPTLQGTVLAEIDKIGATLTSDKLAVSGPLAYGGSLTVLATGDPLTGGEIFDLFDASSFSGAFASSSLPPLGAGLNWYLGNLLVDGSITVNRAPVAGNFTAVRSPNLQLKIKIADLLANSTSDPDADARSLQSVGAAANGGTVSTDATHIFYSHTTNVADSFSYTIGDGRGGTASGTIGIAMGDRPTGMAQSISVAGGSVTIKFAGIPNYHYDVERSEDLFAWTVVGTNIVADSQGRYQYVDNNPPQPNAYYRSAQH